MRLERLRFELRMKLAADEMRMVRQFNHLHISAVRSRTGDAQARSSQRSLVFAIEFVTVPVAFADLSLPVNLMRQCPRLDLARPRAQTHGSTKFLDTAQLTQLINNPMRGRWIELAGIGFCQSANIARKFNARGLHSQADAEVRNLLFTRITNRLQHSFTSTLAEYTGDENSVVVLQLLGTSTLAGLQTFSFNPVHMQL